jgi:nucleoid DNA-binding protein
MAKADAKAKSVKAPSKTEVMASLAEGTGLSKKEVAAVIDALGAEIKKSMSAKGTGAFTIPGLVKITKKRVPARPPQKGVKNPFTGELQDRPAKPAYNKIVVRALKNLKSMA